MKPIGERLRSERLRQGVELSAIADSLCISSRYLQAIENDDWNQLPGGFFRRSFVRQYATALKLDPSQFEGDLDAHRDGDDINVNALVLAQTKSVINVPPMPTHNRRFWDSKVFLSASALIVVVIGCAGLLTVWQRATVSPVAVTPPQGAPKEPAAALTAHEVIPRPASPPVSAEKPPSSSAAAPAATIAAVVGSPGQRPSGPVMIAFSALEQTWLEVSSDGKVVFSGVLQAGETKTIAGTQTARLLVGNAGGITIQFNGKAIGAVGARGEVRRVNFTADSYQIVPLQPQGKPQTD